MTEQTGRSAVVVAPHRSPTRTTPPVRPVGPPDPTGVGYLQVAVRHLISLPHRNRLTGTLCAALTDVAGRAGPAPLVPSGTRTSADDAVAAMAYQLGPALIADPAGRFDPLTRDVIADVLHGWVADPDRYVPVAAHLATALAAPIALAGGWTAVTDRPLRTGCHARLLAWYLTSGSIR